jgi:hypothetical protein
MDPKDVKTGYPYQGQGQAELVDWKRGDDAVVEYLGWLVAGTLHGIIPVR